MADFTEQALRQILGDPWEVTARELSSIGMSVDEAVRQIMTWSQEKDAFVGIEPGVAAWGAFRGDGEVYRTWFVASSAFPDNWRAPTAAMRRLIRDGLKRGLRAETVSIGRDEKARRWFAILGLKEVSPGYYRAES